MSKGGRNDEPQIVDMSNIRHRTTKKNALMLLCKLAFPRLSKKTILSTEHGMDSSPIWDL